MIPKQLSMKVLFKAGVYKVTVSLWENSKNRADRASSRLGCSWHFIKRTMEYLWADIFWCSGTPSQFSLLPINRNRSTVPHTWATENAVLQFPYHNSGKRFLYAPYIYNIWRMGTSIHSIPQKTRRKTCNQTKRSLQPCAKSHENKNPLLVATECFGCC